MTPSSLVCFATRDRVCGVEWSPYWQDFLQILSIFAALNFQWPPQLTSIYDAFSLASFNLDLLAPECSISVNYESKWLITEALPIILVCAVVIVLVCTRFLQFVQRKVFGVVPFGAAGELNLVDVCIGVLITGSYYLYFRKLPGYKRTMHDHDMYLVIGGAFFDQDSTVTVARHRRFRCCCAHVAHVPLLSCVRLTCVCVVMYSVVVQ